MCKPLQQRIDDFGIKLLEASAPICCHLLSGSPVAGMQEARCLLERIEWQQGPQGGLKINVGQVDAYRSGDPHEIPTTVGPKSFLHWLLAFSSGH